MNIGTFFKKYGILAIVACIFVVAIGYFAYDQTKDVIQGKKVDGKDVLLSMDDYNLTADDLYSQLLDGTYGSYAVYMYYVRAVVDNSIETTDELTANAKAAADGLISNYSNDTASLDAALRSAGLRSTDELVNYYLTYYKLTQMISEYEDANLDDLFKPFYEEKSPRQVSHILVKCEDPANPTAEEQAKMDAVDAALNSGTAFADVAKEYSDDTSASNGGALGYADADTSYVTEFLNAMLALNEGEMSEWVKTEYGYHRILVTASSYDTMKADADARKAMESYYPTLELQVIKAAGEKLDVKFSDEKIESLLNSFFEQNLGKEEE